MSPVTEYINILIYLGVALFIGVAALLAGALLGPKRPRPTKLMPYESGNDPIGRVERYPVHFYVVAMLFIIFDVEVAFLWPYAVNAGPLGVGGLIAVIVFVGIVMAGFVYEWLKGVMKWD
ncbi:NADH-quinone oxidoreductase subunit A [Marinithermus hydrothermalis]|uniref:NADH-quinone oxidoreductase subunit A n=1 Tax=Marinithermus hydrothermalis (strain DSM 14884 / JCM 11576 / T1) TaxID=869210 RepID=F2NLZ9_MARHT|nr:NADH-quinone oxidoreductase subunit A [Marinithermus hydrothermalis]AEB11256.1 NAD(P)H-quinone oxidoreductase subunit 3 [Marinithermus hydrothermalis DSM 14884]